MSQINEPLNILIVVGDYYRHICDELVLGATETLDNAKANHSLVRVAGVLEIPRTIAAAERAGHRPAGRIPLLERALIIRSRDGIPRHQLAEVQFLLARALGRSDPERSRQLATAAAAGFRDAGHGFDEDRAAIELWLRP